MPINMRTHDTIPAFLMRIELAEALPATGYLRTLDFESGEVRVIWKDRRGEWLRQIFVSRPDDVVAQLITAPRGQTLRAAIALENPAVDHVRNSGPITFERELNAHSLLFTGRFDPAVDRSGYAGVTRVIPIGGSARVEQGKLVVENAQSLLLLTRIDRFADFPSSCGGDAAPLPG